MRDQLEINCTYPQFRVSIEFVEEVDDYFRSKQSDGDNDVFFRFRSRFTVFAAGLLLFEIGMTKFLDL